MFERVKKSALNIQAYKPAYALNKALLYGHTQYCVLLCLGLRVRKQDSRLLLAEIADSLGI
jgi:hypothetical protein